MLFPLRITWRDPRKLDGLDSPGSCRCDDSCDYAIKDESSHPRTPHNEWFCSELAHVVGIAGPSWAVIEEPSGNCVFGSRWEGGVAKDYWWEMAARGEILLDDIKPALSRILAFDHFVHNEDRHLKNYLARDQRTGWALLAMDYSRSSLFHDFPLPNLPFAPNDKTRLACRVLHNLFGPYIQLSDVNECLDRIAAITDMEIENIINRHPQNWLTAVEKQDILTWWSSTSRLDRLRGIRLGIGNGSYL